MNTSYNLTTERWLPVIMRDGSLKHVNLEEAFTEAHDIRDIVVANRVQRLSILRLLTAVAMRAYPRWAETWNAGSFDRDALTGYLTPYKSRFDLLGPTPFYQVRDLSSKAKTQRPTIPISELHLLRHTTTRDLNVTETLSLAEATRVLITAFSYSPPGRNLTISESCKSSLSWTTTGMLAIGDSLFATIMLNTVENQWSTATPETDLPWWERHEQVEENVERVPTGVADYLTYASRHYELVVDDDQVVGFKMAAGHYWKPEKSEEVVGIDPFSLFAKRKDDTYYREKFQTRVMSARNIPGTKKQRRAYITRGILGDLFVLYTPSNESRSMVHERVSSLDSHWERFIGYEVARLIVDDSMGALIENLVEEGISVPYRLESEPEVALTAVEFMEDVFGLQYEFENALKRLFAADDNRQKQNLLVGVIEKANATFAHYLSREVRAYITKGATEEKQVVLDRIARQALEEFTDWCSRASVSDWQTRHQATRQFMKTAHTYLKKENHEHQE